MQYYLTNMKIFLKLLGETCNLKLWNSTWQLLSNCTQNGKKRQQSKAATEHPITAELNQQKLF